MPKIAVAIELDWPVPHHHDVIQGVQRFAEEVSDWELEIGPFPDVHLRMGDQYDGIVGRITPRILDGARAAGIPVVNTWMNSPVAGDLMSVGVDFRKVGQIAAEHLYARGLRRFVHIGFRGQSMTALHHGAVAAVAKERGCKLKRLLVSPDFEKNGVKWERFIKTIRRAGSSWQTPMGVIAISDNLTRLLTFELGRLGLNVPHDVAVVGCRNDELRCTHTFPTLSSIDLGYDRIGYEAARLLADRMRGKAPSTGTKLFPPKELVVRDSSDFFAVNDTRVAAALRFMAENSERPITVVRVAEAAAISQQKLNKLFHHYVGHTVNTELIRLRVEHFKRLLVQTDEPVRVLSKRSGFGTESLAYSTFRRLTGQTPAQYREERRGRQ